MGVAIHIVEPFDGDTGPYTYMPPGERRARYARMKNSVAKDVLDEMTKDELVAWIRNQHFFRPIPPS